MACAKTTIPMDAKLSSGPTVSILKNLLYLPGRARSAICSALRSRMGAFHQGMGLTPRHTKGFSLAVWGACIWLGTRIGRLTSEGCPIKRFVWGALKRSCVAEIPFAFGYLIPCHQVTANPVEFRVVSRWCSRQLRLKRRVVCK